MPSYSLTLGKRIFLIVSVLIVTVGCALPFSAATPTATPALPAASLSDTEAKISAALDSAAQSGVLSLSLSENELSALVADRLSHQTAVPIAGPYVTLRQGELALHGKMTVASITADTVIVMTFAAAALAEPRIKVSRANFGILPVPGAVLDAISSTLQQLLVGSLAESVTGMRLTTIEVADGYITIQGTTR